MSSLHKKRAKAPSEEKARKNGKHIFMIYLLDLRANRDFRASWQCMNRITREDTKISPTYKDRGSDCGF